MGIGLAIDLRPAEHLETEGRADDVDDRVHRPHLVEVDLFRRAAVHLAFGLGEPPEDAFGRLLYTVGEFRAADDLQDVLQPPVMVVMGSSRITRTSVASIGPAILFPTSIR